MRRPLSDRQSPSSSPSGTADDFQGGQRPPRPELIFSIEIPSVTQNKSSAALPGLPPTSTDGRAPAVSSSPSRTGVWDREQRAKEPPARRRQPISIGDADAVHLLLALTSGGKGPRARRSQKRWSSPSYPSSIVAAGCRRPSSSIEHQDGVRPASIVTSLRARPAAPSCASSTWRPGRGRPHESIVHCKSTAALRGHADTRRPTS